MTATTDSHDRQAFWQEQMTTWKQSGLSGARFCKSNDLNYSQFVYWRQKLLKGKAEQATQEKHGGFTQVLRQSEPLDSLSLSLPNGLVFRGISSDNIGVVRELLENI